MTNVTIIAPFVAKFSSFESILILRQASNPRPETSHTRHLTTELSHLSEREFSGFCSEWLTFKGAGSILFPHLLTLRQLQVFPSSASFSLFRSCSKTFCFLDCFSPSLRYCIIGLVVWFEHWGLNLNRSGIGPSLKQVMNLPLVSWNLFSLIQTI